MPGNSGLRPSSTTNTCGRGEGDGRICLSCAPPVHERERVGLYEWIGWRRGEGGGWAESVVQPTAPGKGAAGARQPGRVGVGHRASAEARASVPGAPLLRRWAAQKRNQYVTCCSATFFLLCVHCRTLWCLRSGRDTTSALSPLLAAAVTALSGAAAGAGVEAVPAAAVPAASFCCFSFWRWAILRPCGTRCVWRKHYTRESDGGCPRLSANGR